MAKYSLPTTVLRKRKLSTRQLPNLPEYAVNVRSKRPHTLANDLDREMNVISICSYPSQPQELDSESTVTSSNGKGGPAAKKRKWTVSIRVNNSPPTSACIEDPFLEADYKAVFEQYLRISDRPRWTTQSLIPDQEGLDEIDLAEERIEEYGKELFDQLDSATTFFQNNAPEAQIYVIERHDSDVINPAVGGIHCLAWELLESVRISRLPKLHLRVTRVSDFPARRLLQPPRSGGKRLAGIQSDPNATFNILLVIARDFTRTSTEREAEPDLAQWPLMNLQKKLRSRLNLEIVRPGSLEELARHLEIRAKQNVEFNLVHFDLHGRIMRNESGVLVPWLLFARQHTPNTPIFSIPQTQLAKAEDVAEVLARYQVENVVLNACLSAYNRSGPASNLAHIFLRYGISNVSAMWFYVHSKTVSTYVSAFYDMLLIKCLDFHVAAQRARETLRQQPSVFTGRTYQDFFICVNYARDVHRTDSMMREVSPSPSAKSHESATSTSNNSAKSFRNGVWIKASPRLGDSLILGDEPIIRLQLHLLELEYKLMTFKIVYASDLRKVGSDLNGTIESMVNMWLNTNLIDEVHYYKAKDFGKRRLISGGVSVSPREKRTRMSNGGPLQRLFPRAVGALRQTLHIVREVDSVVDPGIQADELDNQRREERRFLAQERLQKFAKKLHEDGHSYMIFLGGQNSQWWETYLQALAGVWWLDMPWSFTVHSRYAKEMKPSVLVDERQPAGSTGLGLQ